MPAYNVSVSASESWKTAEFAATCIGSIGSKFVSHKTSAGAMAVICADV